MNYKPEFNRDRAIEFSSIIEDAPYVMSDSRRARGYTSMSSLKCASSQSQNCPRTPMPGELERISK